MDCNLISADHIIRIFSKVHGSYLGCECCLSVMVDDLVLSHVAWIYSITSHTPDKCWGTIPHHSRLKMFLINSSIGNKYRANINAESDETSYRYYTDNTNHDAIRAIIFLPWRHLAIFYK